MKRYVLGWSNLANSLVGPLIWLAELRDRCDCGHPFEVKFKVEVMFGSPAEKTFLDHVACVDGPACMYGGYFNEQKIKQGTLIVEFSHRAYQTLGYDALHNWHGSPVGSKAKPGAHCSICKIYAPHANPDPNFKCWSCKNYPHYRSTYNDLEF